MKTFGMLINEQRDSKGLLFREVTSFVNIDQSIISKFENSVRRPPITQAVRFANIFNITKRKLLIAWLCDRLVSVQEYELIACEAHNLAE